MSSDETHEPGDKPAEGSAPIVDSPTKKAPGWWWKSSDGTASDGGTSSAVQDAMNRLVSSEDAAAAQASVDRYQRMFNLTDEEVRQMFAETGSNYSAFADHTTNNPAAGGAVEERVRKGSGS